MRSQRRLVAGNVIHRDRHSRTSRRHAGAALGDQCQRALPGHDRLQRKTISIYKELEKEGIPPEKFANVHAPVGLEIGAVTPEEIAVAIVAEMIAERRHAATNVASKMYSYPPAAVADREEQDATEEEPARNS